MKHTSLTRNTPEEHTSFEGKSHKNTSFEQKLSVRGDTTHQYPRQNTQVRLHALKVYLYLILAINGYKCPEMAMRWAISWFFSIHRKNQKTATWGVNMGGHAQKTKKIRHESNSCTRNLHIIGMTTKSHPPPSLQRYFLPMKGNGGSFTMLFLLLVILRGCNGSSSDGSFDGSKTLEEAFCTFSLASSSARGESGLARQQQQEIIDFLGQHWEQSFLTLMLKPTFSGIMANSTLEGLTHISIKDNSLSPNYY